MRLYLLTDYNPKRQIARGAQVVGINTVSGLRVEVSKIEEIPVRDEARLEFESIVGTRQHSFGVRNYSQDSLVVLVKFPPDVVHKVRGQKPSPEEELRIYATFLEYVSQRMKLHSYLANDLKGLASFVRTS